MIHFISGNAPTDNGLKQEPQHGYIGTSYVLTLRTLRTYVWGNLIRWTDPQ